MKRTTVMLPDDLATVLDIERRQRDVSASEIVRLALAAYLDVGSAPPKRLSFIGLGASGHHDTASRIDEILAQEWERDLAGEQGLDRSP